MILTSNYTRSIDRNLIAEGYKLFPSQISPAIVDVAKPTGGAYRVDLAAGTCDCAAGQRGVKCCHLREAAAVHSLLSQDKPKQKGFESPEAFARQANADFG